MHFERFDPAADREQLLACYRMFAAASPVDDPNGPVISLAAFGGWWSHGFGGNPQQAWLATDSGGTPAGCYLMELPDRANTCTGFVLPVVPPARRRAGTGSALLAHAAGLAARAGRSVLIGETMDLAAGTSFARALGAQEGLTDLRRVLEVDAALAGRLSGLRGLAERQAAGYSLLSWSGPAAEADVDQLAAVFLAMADAPREASREAEQWDAERVRADEARLAAQGMAFYSAAARHDESGELAALTQVCIDPDLPHWAFQMLTAVTRAHRGHKLGLLVKVAMQELLAERAPDVRRVMTHNTGSNEHMIAVNEQLGYRVTDKFRTWELPVADALARCAGLAGRLAQS